MPLIVLSLFISVMLLARVHANRAVTGPPWLQGPALVVAVLAGSLIGHAPVPQDATALSALYGNLVVPGLLVASASTILPALMAHRSASRAARWLGLAALLAAVGARLDARVLELASAEGSAWTRRWLAERLAVTWAYRQHINAAAVLCALGGVGLLRPTGPARTVVVAMLVMGGVAVGSLDRAWDRLRDPDAVRYLHAQPLPVMEAGTRSITAANVPMLGLEEGTILATDPGQHLLALDLAQTTSVLVLLPGTEILPPSLRWAGWRAVPLAPAADGSQVFGGADQLWTQTADGPRAIGPLRPIPAALAALQPPVVLHPAVDWTVGDLAAICAHQHCALAHPP